MSSANELTVCPVLWDVRYDATNETERFRRVSIRPSYWEDKTGLIHLTFEGEIRMEVSAWFKGVWRDVVDDRVYFDFANPPKAYERDSDIPSENFSLNEREDGFSLESTSDAIGLSDFLLSREEARTLLSALARFSPKHAGKLTLEKSLPTGS